QRGGRGFPLDILRPNDRMLRRCLGHGGRNWDGDDDSGNKGKPEFHGKPPIVARAIDRLSALTSLPPDTVLELSIDKLFHGRVPQDALDLEVLNPDLDLRLKPSCLVGSPQAFQRWSIDRFGSEPVRLFGPRSRRRSDDDRAQMMRASSMPSYHSTRDAPLV